MKHIFILLSCCFYLFASAQIDIKISSEKKNNGYVLYVSNSNYCPVSFSLDLNLTNLKFSEAQKEIFVVPAKTERFKIGELDIEESGAYKYSYNYHYNIGDVTLRHYDTNYVYDLPYQKGKSFRVFQGYNGSFSHQNENAIDFTMPEGTEIVAARDGIVVKIVQSNTQACLQEECKKNANEIIIYQPDGTFSVYAHFRYNGSKVNLGDVVKKGDLIAYSGNTGFSSGPHLHFACFLPGLYARQTLETKFRIGTGTATFLQEKTTYFKDY